MTWAEQRKRIRRMLRDPDRNIWSDALILRLFNDVQRELQSKTNVLEDVEAVRVPPLYLCSYLQDWEWTYAKGSSGKVYKALRYFDQGDVVGTYKWEPESLVGIDSDTSGEEMSIFTHPWEAWIDGAAPGLPVPIWFPVNFDKAKLVAWDREPLEYIEPKQLMSDDSSWATHSGRPSHYWRHDDVENTFILYPRPETPIWDDYVRPGEDSYDYSYTYDWEEPYDYLTGIGHLFTPEHATTETSYVFPWEKEHLDGGSCQEANAAVRTTAFYDIIPVESTEGMVSFVEEDSETGEETGAITRRTGTLFGDSVHGVTTDVIDLNDNVLVIYRVIPTDIVLDGDESDFHGFLQKYVEYGVLERAYGVDCDGKIDSLREYWAYRKELGLKHIKTFMSKRLADRDFRFVTPGVPGRRQMRQPRLPSEYPPI